MFFVFFCLFKMQYYRHNEVRQVKSGQLGCSTTYTLQHECLQAVCTALTKIFVCKDEEKIVAGYLYEQTSLAGWLAGWMYDGLAGMQIDR